MSDEDRFRRVATDLGAELQQYGLVPTTVRLGHTEAAGGWWAKVANWSRTKPAIYVWFDRFYLRHPERHFWFGFEGNEERVARLVSEIPVGVFDYALITDGDLEADETFTQEAANRTTTKGGLAYEKFENYEHFFGKYDDGFHAISDIDLVTQAAKFLGDIVEFLDPALGEKRDIEEIKRSEPDETEREALIKAGRGQGKFRTDLFSIWGGCAVTGSAIMQALRASHIKPWRSCSGKQERLDPNNGLLLVATLDALFDRGLISFNRDGILLISANMSEKERELLCLDHQVKLSKPLSPDQMRYLDGHREIYGFNQ